MKTRLLVLTCLFTLLTVVSAYGQQANVKATIPFQFTAAGKVFPAGDYTFSRNEAVPQQTFRILGPGNESGLVTVLTRTAGGIHTTPKDAHIVFDVMGDTYALSEIWIPGEDGYLFNVTTAKHTHKIVNTPR